MAQNLAKRLIAKWGGGILVVTILSNLNASELKDACENNGGNCNIKNPYTKITNTGIFTGYDSGIDLQKGGDIDTFINYGEIGVKITFLQGTIKHLTNYGTMQGISVSYNDNTNHIVTIENYGAINPLESKYHFKSINLRIANYAMILSESTEKFNNFNGTNPATNSHLVLDKAKSVSFADKNAKLILDFGSGFELGSAYSLSKLIVDTSGTSQMSVDVSHLTTRTSLYKLTQSGDSFIVSLDAPNSEIGILNKSNIRTMNNFITMSNAMIYPRKAQNLGKKNPSLRASEYERGNPFIKKSLDSANHLKSYESFAYRNESINRRIQRQNKRNYNRKSQNLNLDSANENNPSLRADSQNLRGNPNLDSANRDYYFILTPFINHNFFFESGRYNLSGFDYGFLTAFSAKVAESNSLGTHFMMSYGNLGDKQDKDFIIKSLNLNLGLNYKLDLIWDMYLKARGDFFYFLNQAKTLTMIEAIKPNNLGFGASVAYGKDFDFKSGGVLGIEVGLDYKALQSSTISLHDNTYNKSLYNLIYLDLGLNYAKYFNTNAGIWGINAGLGIRGNITANKLAKSQIHISALDRNVDMVLDNDMFLGYANLSASYVLNAKSFDMEFSLAYYGNFGDRIISNAGGFEWRVGW